MRSYLHRLALWFVLREHTAWRKDHEKGTKLEIYKKDLSGSSFYGCDFHECMFNFADFRDSKMAMAALIRADLHGASITNCNVNDVDWTGTVKDLLADKSKLIDQMTVIATGRTRDDVKTYIRGNDEPIEKLNIHDLNRT